MTSVDKEIERQGAGLCTPDFFVPFSVFDMHGRICRLVVGPVVYCYLASTLSCYLIMDKMQHCSCGSARKSKLSYRLQVLLDTIGLRARGKWQKMGRNRRVEKATGYMYTGSPERIDESAFNLYDRLLESFHTIYTIQWPTCFRPIEREREVESNIYIYINDVMIITDW